MVHCTYCSASYYNWRSFLSNLRRKHKDEQPDIPGENEEKDDVDPPSHMDLTVDEGDENTGERSR